MSSNSYIYVHYGGGDILNGKLGLRAAVAAQVKVRVCCLDLLRLRLNGGPVCDDSPVDGGVRTCSTL